MSVIRNIDNVNYDIRLETKKKGELTAIIALYNSELTITNSKLTALEAEKLTYSNNNNNNDNG